MNWTTPKRGDYHCESIPARFFVAWVSVRGALRWSLTDGKELVGWFETEEAAKAAAEARA